MRRHGRRRRRSKHVRTARNPAWQAMQLCAQCASVLLDRQLSRRPGPIEMLSVTTNALSRELKAANAIREQAVVASRDLDIVAFGSACASIGPLTPTATLVSSEFDNLMHARLLGPHVSQALDALVSVHVRVLCAIHLASIQMHLVTPARPVGEQAPTPGSMIVSMPLRPSCPCPLPPQFLPVPLPRDPLSSSAQPSFRGPPLPPFQPRFSPHSVPVAGEASCSARPLTPGADSEAAESEVRG